MPDCCHHSEGEHDKRDMAMPAMPGAAFVMVEPQFILGRLETILDRPAMTLERLFLSSRNFCTRCGEHLNRRAAFVKARGQAKRRREPQTRDDGVKPRILNCTAARF